MQGHCEHGWPPSECLVCEAAAWTEGFVSGVEEALGLSRRERRKLARRQAKRERKAARAADGQGES